MINFDTMWHRVLAIAIFCEWNLGGIFAYSQLLLNNRQGGTYLSLDVMTYVNVSDYLPFQEYDVEAALGTPPQSLALRVSSTPYHFVSFSRSTLCVELTSCELGSYDPQASSTKTVVSIGNLNETTGDATTIQNMICDIFNDTLALGNTRLSNATFGLAVGVALDELRLGLGGLMKRHSPDLPLSLPAFLEQNGQISSSTYSYALDKLNATANGTLLFGAIDTESISALSLFYKHNHSDELLAGIPLYLEPGIGKTTAVLPKPLADSIYNLTGAVLNETTGQPVVDYGLANSNASFSFQFNGPTGPVLTAAIADFVQPDEIHENQQLGLAQSRYTTASNVVPFASKGATIPLATPGPTVPAATVYDVTDDIFEDFPSAMITNSASAPGLREYYSRASLSVSPLALGLSIPLAVLAMIVIAITTWTVGPGRSRICCGCMFSGRQKTISELETNVPSPHAAEMPSAP
ncbi:aspartic peptidase domain-containing protein [Truncatella angustata]|uniref:Aspartic peptidase domain-containing protein n=1 Tax=Truncatella angustata TaxID=152316 RepID=A0A9P8RGY4_9PEZI|nr:aspartic peptidase domain-containing protein [Truncatella angustata]KAH6645833.1 aspartic peptidase domain-containing protein [Truncatella angustata]